MYFEALNRLLRASCSGPSVVYIASCFRDPVLVSQDGRAPVRRSFSPRINGQPPVAYSDRRIPPSARTVCMRPLTRISMARQYRSIHPGGPSILGHRHTPRFFSVKPTCSYHGREGRRIRFTSRRRPDGANVGGRSDRESA